MTTIVKRISNLIIIVSFFCNSFFSKAQNYSNTITVTLKEVVLNSPKTSTTLNKLPFAVSTYLEIKNTISEEKNKHKEKIENEAKIKTLIKYFDAKKNLIDRITETKKSLENRNK